jgi:uncharacterized protein (DUF1499 family)
MARNYRDFIGKPRRGTRWCSIAVWSAGIGLVLVLASCTYRFGLLPSPFAALFIYAIGSLALVVGLVTGTIGLIRSGGSAGRTSATLTWLALLGSVLVTGNNAVQILRASGAPPIHDVSTDTVNPPKFVAVLPLRAAAVNPPEYPGADFAEQQQRAYPDLTTIVMAAPAERVLQRAVEAAHALGWKIVAEVPAEGRIEATDTTQWFGFKDDVVIRITPAATATRVDVRSSSRVGRNDSGLNARRLRAFRDRLLRATGTA